LRLFQLSVSCFLQTLFLLKKGASRSLFFFKKKKGFAIKDSIWGIRLSSKCYFYHSGLSILIYLFYAKHLGTGTKKAQNRLGLKWRWCKGFAHIGVLKVLEEAGVQIDYIGGTSMGAVVGGLYASGYNASQIDSIFQTTNFDELLNDFIPRSSKNFYERRNERY
jgi:NTE family protein